MMKFRTLKANVVSILTTNAGGEFRVLSSQDQGLAGDDVTDSRRTVRVYFKKGAFPRSKSSTEGPIQHDVTIAIEMVAAKAAQGDLAVLESDTATDAQRATALTNFERATDAVDDSIDELIELVYGIIMNASRTDVGIDVGDVANRWIDEVEKTPVAREGQFAIIGAEMPLMVRVTEDITGLTPVAAEQGATTTDLETHVIDSAAADTAPAQVTGGN